MCASLLAPAQLIAFSTNVPSGGNETSENLAEISKLQKMKGTFGSHIEFTIR